MIEKTAAQVKSQMEFWLLKYLNKSREDFSGNEPITLFELLSSDLQINLKQQLQLGTNETPVLVLKVSDSEYVVNTTTKFVQITADSTTFIKYTNFGGHDGYRSIKMISTPKGGVANVKMEGAISDFGLKNRYGRVVYWKIPTGKPGFAFWNVTNKCELIGRKYRIIG